MCAGVGDLDPSYPGSTGHQWTCSHPSQDRSVSVVVYQLQLCTISLFSGFIVPPLTRSFMKHEELITINWIPNWQEHGDNILASVFHSCTFDGWPQFLDATWKFCACRGQLSKVASYTPTICWMIMNMHEWCQTGPWYRLTWLSIHIWQPKFCCLILA